MAYQLNFTPFSVQQLFSNGHHPENDVKKVKATEIANIKIKSVYEQCQKAIVEAAAQNDENAVREIAAIAGGYNLEAAQAYASSHHARLSRRVKRVEIDQILCDMGRKGMAESDLQKVAQIYGFHLELRQISGGVAAIIKRI